MDPEIDRFSREDRDYAEMSRVPVAVDPAMGWIKRHGIMTGSYHGMPERFNEELEVITGLVNFKHGRADIRAQNAELIEPDSVAVQNVTTGRPPVTRLGGTKGGACRRVNAAHDMP